MDAEVSAADQATRRRNEVFRVMFWHEKTYEHRTKTLADGWVCLDCDAKMAAPEEK